MYIYEGDILNLSSMSIVNSADASLLEGGRLHAAIHAACGILLRREIESLEFVHNSSRSFMGDVHATHSHDFRNAKCNDLLLKFISIY